MVVTVYKRADGKESKPVASEAIGKHNKLGYNPAVEAKGFTKSQVDSVRSKKMRSEWAIQDIVSLTISCLARHHRGLHADKALLVGTKSRIEILD